MTDDQAREIQSWPAATLDELRGSIFDGGGDFDSSVDQEKMADALEAVAAGRLIDAGRISEQTLAGEIPAEALRGKFPPIAPIIFSLGSVEHPLLLIPRSTSAGMVDLSSLTAKRSPDGRIFLTHADNLGNSDELRRNVRRIASASFILLRYLCGCKGAVEQVKHSSGISYSRLDVEKAIRLQGAPEPIAPTERPLTLNEARRALLEVDLADFADDCKQVGGTRFVLEAAQQARAGRLFVVEHLLVDLMIGRQTDAYGAVKSGALRTPFPVTFIIVTVAGFPSTFLLKVSPIDAADEHDFMIGCLLPIMLADGRTGWSDLPKEELDEFRGAVQGFAVTILSLIADSRSSVIRVAADDKLNKARVKRGKAPIPTYWKIEAGPTILVPGGAVPVIAAAAKGTHASPRPHDRRGHPRHLKSGREVWVRACRINALLPHLTRGREFYEVRL